jgi:hypothetical protein
MRSSAEKKVQEKLAAIHAAGYPTTPAELDQWYPQVPEEKNAALVLCRAFAAMTDGITIADLPIMKPKPLFPERTEPLPPKMKKAIEAYLAENQTALSLLHKGAALPESRYPVDFSKGIDTLLPHLTNVRMGIRLLYLDAINNAIDGRSKAASEDLIAMMEVSHSLEKEPKFISQLQQIACLDLTSRCLEQLLHRTTFTDNELEKMMTALKEREKDGLSRGIIGGLCMGYDAYQRSEISIKLTKNIRNVSPQSSSSYLDYLKFMLQRIIPRNDYFFYKNSGMMAKDFCYYLEYMMEYVHICLLPNAQRVKASEDLTKRTKDLFYKNGSLSPKHKFLDMLPSLTRIFIIEDRCIASLSEARTALAIERYRLATGKVPDSLEELVPKYLEAVPIDPFDPDEKPLRYVKIKKGYIVYSIGEDGTDNNGTEKDPAGKKFTGDTDVTFIVERVKG